MARFVRIASQALSAAGAGGECDLEEFVVAGHTEMVIARGCVSGETIAHDAFIGGCGHVGVETIVRVATIVVERLVDVGESQMGEDLVDTFVDVFEICDLTEIVDPLLGRVWSGHLVRRLHDGEGVGDGLDVVVARKRRAGSLVVHLQLDLTRHTELRGVIGQRHG